MAGSGKKTEKIVDAETGNDITPKRQTVVTKGITRTLQTAKYFSLTVNHTAQDTIEWETTEEREKKIHNLTKLAVKDFIQTHDTVLDQLKLGQMHAFVTNHIQEKEAEKGPDLLDVEGLDELE